MFAAELCCPGIREKFVQNPILLEILVKCTGKKQIVECSKDRLWGTGTPLAQVDCLDSDRWITPGIMGKILEDIRMEFYSQFNPDHHPLIGIQCNSPVPGGSTPSQLNQNFSSSGPSSPRTSTKSAQSNPIVQTNNTLSHPISGTVIEDDPSGLRQSMFQLPSAPPEVQTESHVDARSMPSEHLKVTSMAVDHPELAENYVIKKT